MLFGVVDHIMMQTGCCFDDGTCLKSSTVATHDRFWPRSVWCLVIEVESLVCATPVLLVFAFAFAHSILCWFCSFVFKSGTLSLCFYFAAQAPNLLSIMKGLPDGCFHDQGATKLKRFSDLQHWRNPFHDSTYSSSFACHGLLRLVHWCSLGCPSVSHLPWLHGIRVYMLPPFSP